jgi:hypothetical protein
LHNNTESKKKPPDYQIRWLLQEKVFIIWLFPGLQLLPFWLQEHPGRPGNTSL